MYTVNEVPPQRGRATQGRATLGKWELDLGSISAPMRLDASTLATRRAAVLAAAALIPFAPSLPSLADDQQLTALSNSVFKGEKTLFDEAPTYSLKGLTSAITGSDKPRPTSVGAFGRGANNQLTGRLNACSKKGCISTFADADVEGSGYVPPWTYDTEYSIQAASSFSSRKQQILADDRAARAAEAAAEDAAKATAKAAAVAAGEEVAEASPAAPPSAPAAPVTPVRKQKSIDQALTELKTAVVNAGGNVIDSGDRYLYAEFTEGGQVDDVEFLISLNNPIVGYRSVPRSGGDDKRQRNRIRDIRKSLAPQGWKSVGRINVD